MLFKACGIRSVKDITDEQLHHIDLIGVNFSPLSKRQPKRPDELISLLPKEKLVLVFKENSLEEIQNLIEKYSPTYVQIYNPALIPFLNVEKIILAVNIRSQNDLETIDTTAIEYLILEGGSSGKGKPIPMQIDLSKVKKPFLLAGGITPDNVTEKITHPYCIGIDVASGIEHENQISKEKIDAFLRVKSEKKDLLKNIIINKNGVFGAFGGRFVPEVIVPVMDDLNTAFFEAIADDAFIAEYKHYLKEFVGRKSPLVYLDNLSRKLNATIYLKNEGANHTGAHKINHVLGQVLIAKRMGKTRIIAETGAGQHGLATATICAKFNLNATIYMGAKDYHRQRPNVYYMEMLGAKVIPVHHGNQTLQSAITEAFKDLIAHPHKSHYLLGTACGPRPYPSMNVFFQKVIGEEIREQLPHMPDTLIACVGGGSNALGMFYAFLDEPTKLIAVEAGGKSQKLSEHATRIPHGKLGVFEGFSSKFLIQEDGNMAPTHSISAGMDYSGISPQLAYLNDIHRVQFVSENDVDVLNAVKTLAREEGILPALESAHAIAFALKYAESAPKNETIVINCSGRGEKDLFITMPHFQPQEFQDYIERFQNPFRRAE